MHKSKFSVCDPAERPAVQDLSRFKLPPDFRGRPAWFVQLWWLVQGTLFRLSPQVAYGWRRFLLRLFGARVGAQARLRPSVRCVFPWRLTIGPHAWVGDRVTLYSLDDIEIGPHAVVSHESYLCTGTHDPDDPAFAIRTAPVRIGAESWVACGVYVAPGVRLGRGAVVGMRALVLDDVPAMMVAYGHPARPVRPRTALTGDRASSQSDPSVTPQPASRYGTMLRSSAACRTVAPTLVKGGDKSDKA